MATSEATIQDSIAKTVWIFQKLQDRGNAGTDPLDEIIDDVTKVVEQPWAGGVVAALTGLRAGYSAILSVQTVRAALDPQMREYARFIGIPERTDINGILIKLNQNFVDNSKSVEERAFTYGSISAGGSNIGDGLVNRLTVDKDSFNIETVTTDAKEFLCTADEHSGAREHQEVFEARGAARNFDNLEVTGSGRIAQISAVSARDTSALVKNPSFSTFTGTAGTPTALGGWLPTTAPADFTNFELVLDSTTGVYRDGDGATTQYSLKIKTATDGVDQNLNTLNARFNPNVPYYCQVAWNRSAGSGSGGSIELGLGSQTVQVALAAQSGWQILRLPLTSGLWFQNWNQEDPKVSVKWTTFSSGYVLIDDFILAPMTQFDGSWFSIVGGETPFLRDDVFTFTDSATESVVQYWLWYAYGLQLPPSGSPTWADPT